MIYFLQDSSNCGIKIGYTGDDTPLNRIANLQTGNPSKLILLATCPGDRSFDAKLKQRFKAARFGDGGEEFFRPIPLLLKYIISRAAIEEATARLIAAADDKYQAECVDIKAEEKLEEAEQLIYCIESDGFALSASVNAEGIAKASSTPPLTKEWLFSIQCDNYMKEAIIKVLLRRQQEKP